MNAHQDDDTCNSIFQIVGMLNMMFGLFDVMTEKNGIYKVTLVLLMSLSSLPVLRQLAKQLRQYIYIYV